MILNFYILILEILLLVEELKILLLVEELEVLFYAIKESSATGCYSCTCTIVY